MQGRWSAIMNVAWRRDDQSRRDRNAKCALRPACRTSPRRSCIDTLCERDGEDAPLVDALRELVKTRRGNELVELGLGASPHHPRLAAAVARERAGDQLELGVPRLSGVEQIARG